MSVLPALARLAWASVRRRPLQSLLLVLGVALGVAVFVAVELANQSALAAFQQSQEAVTGRATHAIVGDGRGLPEGVYLRLRQELGLHLAAPVVEGQARLAAQGGESLSLLGLDPFAEAPFRKLLGDGGAAGIGSDSDADTGGGAASDRDAAAQPLLARPDAVLLSQDLAARLGLAAGDALELDVEGRRRRLTVAGLLAPADALSRRALEGVLLLDIATAQAVLDRPGRLDRIDLILSPSQATDPALLRLIEALLPPGAVLEAAGGQAERMAAMTQAFRLNLRALSLLALLVAVFLIFNSLRFSVVQRRAALATLRALGLSRPELARLLVLEALLLGGVGTALGLLLGLAMGRGAVALVSEPLNDLYLAVTVRAVQVPPAVLLQAALAGMGAALAGALVPAWEGSRIPPVTALRRSEQEAASRSLLPRLLALGLVLALLGLGALALPGRSVALGFLAMACLLLAAAAWVPAGLLALSAAGERLAALLPDRRSGGSPGLLLRLASRNLARSLSRTAVAVAALMVAVCVSIGVDLMVGSFRQTVVLWLGQTLQADLFIAPPGLTATRGGRSLPRPLAEALAAAPAVADWATARGVRLRSPALGLVDAVALSRDLAGADRRYDQAPPGGAAAAWQAAEEGAVLVSEPFAYRHDLGLGDALTLDTDAGPRSFPIAGVFRDYGSEQGVIFLSDAVYRRHWQDPELGSLALLLQDGVDVEAYAATLRQALAASERGEAWRGEGLSLAAGLVPEGLPVLVRSNRGLREEVLQVFDRAFAVTGALRLLALAVAFIGVLSALLALQLSRARELATLRAMGMGAGSLSGLMLLETSLLGLAAGLFSWPTGLMQALLLIHVVNRRSFGWTIEPSLSAEPFAAALALALLAAVLAALAATPGLRRLPIARMLREE